MSALRLALIASGALLAVVPAAQAGLLAPSAVLDTAFAPPTGVARFDLAQGTAPDLPTAIAVAGDRTYTVGDTRGPDGDTKVLVVARRRDGSLDTGFNGTGTRTVSIAPANGPDTANGIVVLPDGRLRIVGATDVDPSSTVTSLDAMVVGLRPDGSLDPAFGTGGIVTFGAPGAAGDDVLDAVAVDGAGRLAVAGSHSSSGQKDSLVALLGADGALQPGFGTAGVQVVPRAAGNLDDEAVDVVFGPDGRIVTLLRVATAPKASADHWQLDPNAQDPNWTDPRLRIDAGDEPVAVLRALRPDGSADPSFGTGGEVTLATGQAVVVPTALVADASRLWATGTTHAAGATDFDAFVARVDGDGGGQQARRFDLRGTLVPADQAVNSAGLDLAVVPGVPTSLAVAGVTGYTFNGDPRTDWAVGVFNGLDGDLSAAGFGELAVDTPNRTNRLTAVAADTAGTAMLAGPLDAEPRGNSVTLDTSFGNARLLVDAEKRCNLKLTYSDPLELVFSGLQPSSVGLRVEQVGTRPCAGTIDVPAPFALSYQGQTGPISTGLLTPGDVFSASGVQVAYQGPRPIRQSLLRATLAVSGDTDADTSDNVASMVAGFAYCDVALSGPDRALDLPSEGVRRVALQLRNTGTVPCREVRLGSLGGGRLTGAFTPFTLMPGRGATSRVALAAAQGSRPGQPLSALVAVASGSDDIEPANDGYGVSGRVVGVGDSDITRVRRGEITGRARNGRGAAKPRSTLLRRVQLTIQRIGGPRCRVVRRGRRGALRLVARAGRRCGAPVWLTATGRRRWRLDLGKGLAPGRYLIRSRAVTRNGFAEARFARADRNRRIVRVG